MNAMQQARRSGLVFQKGVLAGRVEELRDSYRFTYESSFIASDLPAVSLTLPKRAEPYVLPYLFPFFFSLLAEGALAQEQCRRLRIDERDNFARLIHTTAGEVIGSVSVEAEDTP